MPSTAGLGVWMSFRGSSSLCWFSWINNAEKTWYLLRWPIPWTDQSEESHTCAVLCVAGGGPCVLFLLIFWFLEFECPFLPLPFISSDRVSPLPWKHGLEFLVQCFSPPATLLNISVIKETKTLILFCLLICFAWLDF